MTNNLQNEKGLSGNLIKILALITMTVDHLGLMLFPHQTIFRAVGRIAMPLFAYMIAEGCYYTRNKLRYFLSIFVLGALCQVVFWFSYGTLQLSILMTFSLSIALIYCFDYLKRTQTAKSIILTILCSITVLVLTVLLPKLLYDYKFSFDYGIQGVLIPVLVYLFKTKWQKLISVTAMLCWLSVISLLGAVQWFSLISVLILATYNGKRGKLKLKYLFYVYYPLHISVIYLISMLIA